MFVEREGDDSVRRNAAYRLMEEGKIEQIYTLTAFENQFMAKEE